MDKWFKNKTHEQLENEEYERQKKEEIKNRSNILIHKFKKEYPDDYIVNQVLKWKDYYYILFNGEYPCTRTNYIRLLEKDFWDNDFINKESICYTGFNGNEHIVIIEKEHLKECSLIADFR